MCQELLEQYLSILASFCTIITVVVPMTIFLIKVIRNRNYKEKIRTIDERILGDPGMKHYVSTRVQKGVDPSNKADGDLKADKSIKQYNLIRYFIKKVFTSACNQKYFIILSDSGMGKTTVLLNLIRIYYKKIIKRYDIEFVSLSNVTDLKRLNVPKPYKTILLLDALDEDKSAQENPHKRLLQICEDTSQYFKIIVTCRTQFFLNEDDEPFKTNVSLVLGPTKLEIFEKFYISHFTDSDVKKYLKKTYGLRKKKIARATEIINRCSNLVVRPLLLSYITALSDINKSYSFTYEIYEELISEWLNREASNDKNLGDKLYEFSYNLALYLYNNNLNTISGNHIDQIGQLTHSDLDPIVLRSKSLLNRDREGNYKFAHRSILEYLVAKEAFNNKDMRINAGRFRNFEMTRYFLSEMCCSTCERQDYSYMPIGGCNRNANLSNRVLNNCDFSYSNLQRVNFSGSQLENADFSYCNLKMSDLSNASIKSSNFTHTNAEMASFRKSDLSGSNFTSAIFREAEFARAKLCNVFLYETILVNTQLRGAQFQGAQLVKVNLNGAKVVETNFQDTILDKVKCNKEELEELKRRSYLPEDFDGHILQFEDSLQ